MKRNYGDLRDSRTLIGTELHVNFVNGTGSGSILWVINVKLDTRVYGNTSVVRECEFCQAIVNMFEFITHVLIVLLSGPRQVNVALLCG